MVVFQSMQCGSGEVDDIHPDHDFWDNDHFECAVIRKLFFIENKFAGDETNWWIPNRACVEVMLTRLVSGSNSRRRRKCLSAGESSCRRRRKE